MATLRVIGPGGRLNSNNPASSLCTKGHRRCFRALSLDSRRSTHRAGRHGNRRNLKRADMICRPSDVSAMRWLPCKSRLSIIVGVLCGQRIASRLSIRTVSVSGLYMPPGEIWVGGLGELGRTQTLPFPLALSVGGVCETAALAKINVTEASRTAKVESIFFMGTIYAQTR